MCFTQLLLTSDSHHSGHWLLVSMVIVIECERMSKNDSSHIAWKALMQLLTSYDQSVNSLVCLSFRLHVPVRLSFFPCFWTPQLAYLLISAIVCMWNNMCLCVCLCELRSATLQASLPNLGVWAWARVFTVNMPSVMILSPYVPISCCKPKV